jgi:hypothetical protein
LIGIWINGRPLGVLIDARNKMSLSRLQIVLWTWLLLSAVAAVGFAYSTADIEMPVQVWGLLGISVGSTAGSVIVKGTKGAREPAPAAVAAVPPAVRRGLLSMNAAAGDAALADLFRGDEVIDCRYVDISKVQMFFFTVVALMCYAGALWNFPFESNAKVTFPDLSESVVVLLGISHAGYLTVKAAPRTPTA